MKFVNRTQSIDYYGIQCVQNAAYGNDLNVHNFNSKNKIYTTAFSDSPKFWCMKAGTPLVDEQSRALWRLGSHHPLYRST